MVSIKKKYLNRIEKEFSNNKFEKNNVFSKEYLQFKKEYLPKHLSHYETWCNISEKILHLKLNKKDTQPLQEAIEITHLNVTPEGTVSFSILIPLIFIIVTSSLSFLFLGSGFAIFFLLIGLLFMWLFQKLPSFFANNWRLKASNQMVLCIFYVVTFMRHTSNIERAIQFASNHLEPPLSLDLKKVLWDFETEKYESVKESLDIYLNSWKKWNSEFIEAFHLIEGSLYEPAETRRLNLLDKSLDVILQETYEKMLHYAYNLKSPINILHMIGVILPILGLVILPLVASFITSETTTPGSVAMALAMMYNVILPISVFTFGKIILSKRPTGYGQADISKNKAFQDIQKIKFLGIEIQPWMFSLTIFLFFLMLTLIPIYVNFVSPGTDFSFLGKESKFFDFRPSKFNSDVILGPYGVGATILSLLFTVGTAIAIGIGYKLKSKNLIKIRNETKKLENEFASAMFQLGNRLGDGLPAEIAFQKVAEVSQDTRSGKFFSIVSQNINRLGMSVEQSIFDKKVGALQFFPSKLIESSMKVLTESVKKGPKVAAQAMINIARYVKEMHRVDERLKDLLADIISSMKSQIGFLAPAIAGVVVGITSMITTVLNRLQEQLQTLTGATDLSSAGGASGLLDLFGDGMPTYYFQMIVGIYIIQIVYILTVISNGIENGFDKLNERHSLGKNLIKSPIMYAVISLIVVLIFHVISITIIKSIAFG